MSAFSSAALLQAWEGGVGRSLVERALGLLEMADQDTFPDTPAMLPIGERDARLLALRERAFGPQLTGLIDCPSCGERLELDFAVDDVRAGAPRRPPGAGHHAWARVGDDGSPGVELGDMRDDDDEGGDDAEAFDVAVGDFHVRFRLPTSLDVAAIPADADVPRARDVILARCVLEVRRKGRERPAEPLPAEVHDAVVARMAEADPQADVQLALVCPVCGHSWQATFDIATTVCAEVDAWAKRLLREVHALASAYGWREADILALGPRRRQAYLEMVAEERGA